MRDPCAPRIRRVGDRQRADQSRRLARALPGVHATAEQQPPCPADRPCRTSSRQSLPAAKSSVSSPQLGDDGVLPGQPRVELYCRGVPRRGGRRRAGVWIQQVGQLRDELSYAQSAQVGVDLTQMVRGRALLEIAGATSGRVWGWHVSPETRRAGSVGR